ncbi:MAG: L-fucose:H+ symporter permease [Methylococcales bacterium]|nr:MAG: L-fucose:H+ symporter permease [Methylococcales bacterium]
MINGADTQQSSYSGSLSLLTTLFFIWGFITCLNDILIPHLKAVFTLSYTQAMLVQFCFFAAYFVVSVPSGYLLKKISYKAGIVTGLAIASIGCLLFYPAANLQSYSLFLVALFVLASGITLLQVAANPYVTLLGKPESASSRLTITQAFNSLGTTIAPYFGALIVLAAAVKSTEEIAKLNSLELSTYQSLQAAAVQIPYLGLATLLLLMAIVFALIKLPDIQLADIELDKLKSESILEKTSAWAYRHLVLGALGIFMYVGAEVCIGSFLISFLIEPQVAGLSIVDAGKYASFYWGGAMVGRFLGAMIMQKVPANKLLTFNALIAVMLVLTAVMGSGQLVMWAVLAVGLCNSIMFPTLFSLAINGLGKHTRQGSGILCTAIVGGAILPLIQGVFADSVGIQNAFIIPALCYAYIVFYGYEGHRPALKV